MTDNEEKRFKKFHKDAEKLLKTMFEDYCELLCKEYGVESVYVETETFHGFYKRKEKYDKTYSTQRSE